MAFINWIRPSNRKMRLVVGLFLAAMFCIQCTHTDADRVDSELAVSISGQIVGKNASSVMEKVDKWAKTDHLALLEYCQQNYKGRYLDYTCTLVKQERINGVLGKDQWIDVKFMEAPFSVAMKWVQNSPIGDHALFVEGKYNDLMLVKPKGMLAVMGTVARDPKGRDAMANTLRPICEFGFSRSLKNLVEVYKQAKEAGDLKEEFGGYVEMKSTGRKAAVLIRYLPAKNDYPAKKTVTYIDLEYLLPICVEGYNWDDQLSSLYIFKNVKFNVGLKAEDFLPENNEMKSPK